MAASPGQRALRLRPRPATARNKNLYDMAMPRTPDASGAVPDEQELLQQQIDELRQALQDAKPERARTVLAAMPSPEIARLLEGLPGGERDRAWDTVPMERQGEILADLEDHVRAGLLTGMDARRIAELAGALATDDVADILQDLPQEDADRVLLLMDRQPRERLVSVLAYPEDQAGGLMNTDVVTVRADVSLEAVGRYLRKLRQVPEGTDSLIVVDKEHRYMGLLSLASVLTKKAELSVAESMDGTGRAIPADMPAREVARLFTEFDLVSAPVVDAGGILLGRITVDDVVDVIHKQAGRAVMNMAGLKEEEENLFAPILASARSRFFWLGINLLTAFLAAWVIDWFQTSIEKLVALAVLMPVVASMGGIAGSQTLTVTIRGLALGHLGRANARLLLYKELAVGLLNGLAWTVVVAAVARAWFGSMELGLVFGAALFFNLIVAAGAGVAIPFLLRRSGIDPAIAGGVVLTTVTDIFGFLSFLGLGTILLL